MDGAACRTIESRPREGKTSRHTHSVIRIRKDHDSPALLENFRKEMPARRPRYRPIENVQGIRTARTLELTDLGRTSRTVLKPDKLEYNVALKAESFTVEALRREP